METDDRVLAEAILSRGDERAFRTLYRRHTPRLLQLVLRLLGGTEAEAEDVVQETWLRACQGLDGFRWQSSFATWLTTIGVHQARDALRRRGRDRLVPTADPPDTPVAPPELAQRIDLEQAIAGLTEGCRQVLVLHDVQGMTHREIGAVLGIAEGTSKSQLWSARRTLRARLGWRNEGPGEGGESWTPEMTS
jgi:RNA polymerase sigma-70 factor (ECF subfamily)